MKIDNQAANFLGHQVPASHSWTTDKKFVKKGVKVALVTFFASQVQLVSGNRDVEVDKLKTAGTNAVSEDKGAYLRTDELTCPKLNQNYIDSPYKGGGLDWDWKAECKEDGWFNIPRERDPSEPHLFDSNSFSACNYALTRARKFGRLGYDQFVIDDSETTDSTKPSGCYIQCIDGVIHGRFNRNAYNYSTNPGNEGTQPLCTSEEYADPNAANAGSLTCPALCGDDNCVYKEGGLDWDWKAECKEDGFVNILRERDPLNQGVFDQNSFEACNDALTRAKEYAGLDSSQMVIDAEFEASDSTKPSGCYTQCIHGVIHGRFNRNAYNYSTNPGNEGTQPLCKRVTAAPSGSPVRWTPYPTFPPVSLPPTQSAIPTITPRPTKAPKAASKGDDYIKTPGPYYQAEGTLLKGQKKRVVSPTVYQNPKLMKKRTVKRSM